MSSASTSLFDQRDSLRKTPVMPPLPDGEVAARLALTPRSENSDKVTIKGGEYLNSALCV